MRSLRRAFTGKTSLFIAHRLTTVIDADIIYVLENGRVSESGTHVQLLNRGGKYTDLWNSQHRYNAGDKSRSESKMQEPQLQDFESNNCCGNLVCNR